jgi:hypothetical protein
MIDLLIVKMFERVLSNLPGTNRKTTSFFGPDGELHLIIYDEAYYIRKLSSSTNTHVYKFRIGTLIYFREDDHYSLIDINYHSMYWNPDLVEVK